MNGIDICVGKLAVYTGAAGIHPGRVIAVGLDCGTDNQVLLNDPLYLGNRHSRTTGKAYDDFIALYLSTVSELFPNACTISRTSAPATPGGSWTTTPPTTVSSTTTSRAPAPSCWLRSSLR